MMWGDGPNGLFGPQDDGHNNYITSSKAGLLFYVIGLIMSLMTKNLITFST
jgi:hypothetical protein